MFKKLKTISVMILAVLLGGVGAPVWAEATYPTNAKTEFVISRIDEANNKIYVTFTNESGVTEERVVSVNLQMGEMTDAMLDGLVSGKSAKMSEIYNETEVSPVGWLGFSSGTEAEIDAKNVLKDGEIKQIVYALRVATDAGWMERRFVRGRIDYSACALAVEYDVETMDCRARIEEDGFLSYAPYLDGELVETSGKLVGQENDNTSGGTLDGETNGGDGSGGTSDGDKTENGGDGGGASDDGEVGNSGVVGDSGGWDENQNSGNKNGWGGSDDGIFDDRSGGNSILVSVVTGQQGKNDWQTTGVSANHDDNMTTGVTMIHDRGDFDNVEQGRMKDDISTQGMRVPDLGGVEKEEKSVFWWVRLISWIVVGVLTGIVGFWLIFAFWRRKREEEEAEE